MAFRYSASVREAACRRMLAGERVEEVAGDLEMSAATRQRLGSHFGSRGSGTTKSAVKRL